MQTIYWLIALAAVLAGGTAFGYQLRRLWAVRRKDSIEVKVEELVNEAKAKQKEILLEANDKALKIIETSKQDIQQEQKDIQQTKQRLEQRETRFDQQLLELENRKQELEDKTTKIESIKQEILKIKEQQLAKLEKVAQLSQPDAKQVLLDHAEREYAEDLANRIKKLADEGSAEVERHAKQILSLVMQRCAASHASESTTSSVDLPSDEMKGRIIGREGRNIRTLEQLTGTEIIVDDTPNAITISGFSPIRRQVAKVALQKLLLDGRIQPARIEEAVETAKREIAKEIRKAGEEACYDLGVTGLDPKLVQILGRLKYRTSYGQNILQHSIEVAHLSVLLAQELKANVKVARIGGLLHDIGKAVDHEVQGGHPQIGYDIMKKFGLAEEVAYISIAHHEDSPKTLEGAIVKVADAISGARPGARKDTYEQYLQRLEDLEQVAASFDQVEKAYAIQAGREVRVFVSPEQVTDLEAMKLARDIARKVEAELKYPGEVRVTLIRETRIVEYAR